MLAWFHDRLVPLEQVHIEVRDAGFAQSVTAVERLRTWRGQVAPLAPHLQRLARTCQVLQIPDAAEPDFWRNAVSSVLKEHPSEDDWGLTLLATPGPPNSAATRIVMAEPLDHQRLERFQQAGQPLVISDVQQPSPACWPRDIKVRARLHYYLADQHARQQAPDALAVLRDEDGSITETSTSNVLCIRADSKQIRMPPADRVLPGVMGRTLIELMQADGWTVERASISPQQLRDADEVWLTGSLVGLWAANSVDGIRKPLSDNLRLWQMRLLNHLANPSSREA